MTIIKVFLFLLLSAAIQANNNVITDLTQLSSEPLYNLDKEELIQKITPFLKKNSNIKALKIIENIDNDNFLIFFRDDKSFVFSQKIPKNIKKLKKYESNISYDDEIIGKAIVYLHHNLSTLDLTSQEIAYLDKKDSLKICVDNNWYPLEAIKNAKYTGISSAYMTIFSKKIGLPIKIINTDNWSESLKYAELRKCDILPLAMKTPSREKYIAFTTPYFTSSLIIVGSIEEQFVGGITQLKNKKIGITRSGAYYELLKDKYKNINIVEIETLEKGFKLIKNGELDGYIGSIHVLGKQIQEKYASDIKVIARLNENWELAVATRNDEPLLNTIFQKAINSLAESEHNKIKNRYLALTIEKKVDYSLIWKISSVIFIIILLLSYRQLLLKKANKQLKDLVKKLEEDEKQLKLLASTDPLTKLYNRRYFYEISKHLFDLMKRNKNNLSLLMLDIDKFKNVNDTYGHNFGDNILIEFAQILQELTRKSDIICRWGGEEFIILLPQTNNKGALAMAEKIRENVQNNIITLDDGGKFQFTVSIGVHTVDHNNDINIEQAINKSDLALYEAKKSGRNRVCSI